MSASPTARVRAALLIWARTSANLTVEALAKRTKLSVAEVTGWEEGEGAPTVDQLRAIAKACRRPLVVFYLPEPPQDFDAMHDYRRLDASARVLPSPELASEIRRAHEIREAAAELVTLSGEPPRPFPLAASLDEDPEKAAVRARAALSVPFSRQAGWRDAYAALRSWRSAIEDLGVLTLQTQGVRVAEARGLSIPGAPFPVIVVNGADAPNGRIFSLMHELAHLALGLDARCRIAPQDEGSWAAGRIEQFCNAFAGAVLIPRADLLATPVVARAGRAMRWSERDLETIARTFGVSEEVVLRRLLAVGRTTEQFYRQKRDEYLAQPRPRGAGGDYYSTKVARFGRSFIRLVFTGLAEGHISGVDAAAYLGAKMKQFDRLQRTASGE